MIPLLAGAIAGFVATLPMTLFMKRLHRHLPEDQREPLPPYQITTRLAEQAGFNQLTPQQRTQATLAAHFGFGAFSGAFYPLVARPGASSLWQGMAFGLAIWGLSYLGWVPATRTLPPATRQPAPRVGLMIAAHLVWGPVTAWLSRLMLGRPQAV